MKHIFFILILITFTFNTLARGRHHSIQIHTETTRINSLNEPIKVVLTNTNQPSLLPTGLGITESESHYKSISNLNGSNWILGDQKIEDYTNKIYDFVTKNNVTKCSNTAPFVKLGDDQCFNCTEDKPLFDLKAEQCTACPTGTLFDVASHICKASQCKNGQKWNVTLKKCVVPEQPQPTNTPTTTPTDKCTGNRVWNDSQKKCICPDQYPIDIGCECVTCLQPFVWNSTQKSCSLRCPNTYEWNPTTKQCQCPKATPYDINGECIACNLPFEWDSTAKKCDFKKSSNCPTQTVVSSASNNPTTSPTISNTTASSTNANTTQTVQNTSTTTTQPSQTNTSSGPCSSNYVYDSNLKQCVCPSNLLFNDGTKCVDCKLPQYWDHDLKKCLFCPDSKYFNTLTKTCEQCPTRSTFNLTTKKCESSGSNIIDPSVISYKERPTVHHKRHRLD